MNPNRGNYRKPSTPCLEDRAAFGSAVSRLQYQAGKRAARNRGGIFWDDVRYSSAEDFAAAHGLGVSNPFHTTELCPDGYAPRLGHYGDSLFRNREFFTNTTGERAAAIIALHLRRAEYFGQSEFILRLSNTLMTDAHSCRSWYRRGFLTILLVRRDGPSMGRHEPDGDATPIHDQKGTVKLPGTYNGIIQSRSFLTDTESRTFTFNLDSNFTPPVNLDTSQEDPV